MKSTCIESMEQFTYAEYLREPNVKDTEMLLTFGVARRFLGMLSSVYCMYWRWKNCQTSLHGRYQGHTKKATVILEVVASKNLCICHAFFGMLGFHNDINALQGSPLLKRPCVGDAPACNYTINVHDYNMWVPPCQWFLSLVDDFCEDYTRSPR